MLVDQIALVGALSGALLLTACGDDGAGAAPRDSGTDAVGAPDGSTAGGGAADASPGGSEAGNTGGSAGTCPGLPSVTDYAAAGPFDVKVISDAGPTGMYYLFRPDTTLGKDGFKHQIAAWGNGVSTTPDQYTKLLSHIASHGFVVIACPDTRAERACLDAGMEWLVQQNSAEGPLKDKLDTSKELTIGYSWGGGAAIDTADRPNVKATVSIHGMPPRGQASAWTAMKSPLLLFTSTGDAFVTAEQYVTPNFNSSMVPTFYATLQEDVGHLYPLDEGSIGCVAGPLVIPQATGPCTSAGKEQAPTVAWLRLWACDDANAKQYFYGPSCTLCQSPWAAQSKPATAFQ
jgi:hypothetical protein